VIWAKGKRKPKQKLPNSSAKGPLFSGSSALLAANSGNFPVALNVSMRRVGRPKTLYLAIAGAKSRYLEHCVEHKERSGV
jgi:hypothetical protein